MEHYNSTLGQPQSISTHRMNPNDGLISLPPQVAPAVGPGGQQPPQQYHQVHQFSTPNAPNLSQQYPALLPTPNSGIQQPSSSDSQQIAAGLQEPKLTTSTPTINTTSNNNMSNSTNSNSHTYTILLLFLLLMIKKGQKTKVFRYEVSLFFYSARQIKDLLF